MFLTNMVLINMVLTSIVLTNIVLTIMVLTNKDLTNMVFTQSGHGLEIVLILFKDNLPAVLDLTLNLVLFVQSGVQNSNMSMIVPNMPTPKIYYLVS